MIVGIVIGFFFCLLLEIVLAVIGIHLRIKEQEKIKELFE